MGVNKMEASETGVSRMEASKMGVSETATIGKHDTHDVYDIVQAPRGLRAEDLPAEIAVGEQFTVDGVAYELAVTQRSGLRVCEENGVEASLLNESQNYYIIRKV